jgi:hypothetical protein
MLDRYDFAVEYRSGISSSESLLSRDWGRAMQNKVKMRHFEPVTAPAEEMHFGRRLSGLGCDNRD